MELLSENTIECGMVNSHAWACQMLIYKLY